MQIEHNQLSVPKIHRIRVADDIKSRETQTRFRNFDSCAFAIYKPASNSLICFLNSSINIISEGSEDSGAGISEGSEDSGAGISEGSEDSGAGISEGSEDSGAGISEGSEDSGAGISESSEDSGTGISESSGG
ncbi:hypothetical protein HNY73_007494 [Argiope bruennichi]|uniref:Uncharacterized protein n=1 Tax=Argiope bruennichi TaxID=94029 RepID=A0A8T0FE51_ARGBR|nr:hypothetical protein HNY73_007494 [Argiope bruennichi]